MNKTMENMVKQISFLQSEDKKSGMIFKKEETRRG